MSQVKFPDKVDVVFQPVYIAKPLRMPFGDFLYLLKKGRKNVFNRGIGIGTQAVDVFVTGFKIKFDAGDPCSILPTVVLLLHEKMQLIHAIGDGAILCQIIFKRFQKAYQGYSAFMVDPVAHSERDFKGGCKDKKING
jgi:hypothetical protein